MEETLEQWFGSHSLELKTIDVEPDTFYTGEYDYPHLYKAVGEFIPCLFDIKTNGPSIAMLYLLEVAYVDNRFENTKLIFDTDTTFRIV